MNIYLATVFLVVIAVSNVATHQSNIFDSDIEYIFFRTALNKAP